MDLSRYVDLFVSEGRGHLAALEEILRAAEHGPLPGSASLELRRRFHSLKGMAATMGYDGMTAVAEAAWTLADATGQRRSELRVSEARVLLDAVGCLTGILARVERREAREDDDRSALVDRLREAAASALRGGDAPNP